MFCSNCGNQNADGANFCNSCGAPIVGSSAAIPQPYQYQAPANAQWGMTGMTMNPPGKNLILVPAILYIISGIIAVIVGLAGMDAANSVDSFGSFFGVSDMGSAIEALSIAGILIGIVETIFGIVGVSYCKNIEKAYIIMVLGGIDLLLSIIMLAIAFSAFGFTSLVMPILYLAGGSKNNNAYATFAVHNQPHRPNSPQKTCEKCGVSYARDTSSCPKCGFRPVDVEKVNTSSGSSWVCNGCGTQNGSTQFFCKNCGKK